MHVYSLTSCPLGLDHLAEALSAFRPRELADLYLATPELFMSLDAAKAAAEAERVATFNEMSDGEHEVDPPSWQEENPDQIVMSCDETDLVWQVTRVQVGV